jgi:hypothetical protein
MADSIRKQILKDIEAAVLTVDSLVSVGPGRLETMNQDRPAAGIIPIQEDAELITENTDENDFIIFVRVVVDEGAEHALYVLEDVIADVEAAVMSDRSRGGLADDTQRLGPKYLFVDREDPHAGADVRFKIVYQSVAADPTAQRE